MPFTTFADWSIAEVDTLGPVALSSVTGLVQQVVPGSDRNLYQASAFHGKLNTKSNGRFFRVVVAVMARPSEQRRQSPQQRLLKSLLEISNVMCSFDPIISLFLKDTGPLRYKGRVAVECFRTIVAS